MRKYLWLLLLLIIVFWIIVAKNWTGTEKPPQDYDFPPATTTPLPDNNTFPDVKGATNTATPSAFFEATSSSVKLTAPTITVDYRY